MRTPNLGTVSYAPEQIPDDPEELKRFLRSEFQKIQVAIQLLAAGHLDITTVAPVKPRDGDIRYAQGTSWNPGSGVGIYYYKGATSAWVFLG